MSDNTPDSTQQSIASDATEVLIAGQGIAGLTVGLTLHTNGQDVTVAPSGSEHCDRVSSIPLGPATSTLLSEIADVRLDDCTTHARTYQYLDGDGATESSFGTNVRFTASDSLEAALRDRLPAAVLAQDSPVDPGTAPMGSEAEMRDDPGVSSEPGSAPAESAASPPGRESTVEHPGLFVAADGWLSPTRQRLLPEVTPEYAGYVAWHGTRPAADVPDDLVDRFASAITVSRTDHDLLVVTVIPGADGGTDPDERRVQWTWYTGVPARDLGAVLTDRDGTNHDRAVPPGDLKEEYVDALYDRAAVHAPGISRLVRATPDPGVEPVVDVSVPSPVVGHTVFVGDAAFRSRDHTASATEKAAEDARTLVACLARYEDLDVALEDWATTQELRGRQLVEAGRQTDLDNLLERA